MALSLLSIGTFHSTIINIVSLVKNNSIQYLIRHSYKKSHSNRIFPAENDIFDIINVLFLNTILSPLQNSVLTCLSRGQGKVPKLLQELQTKK